MCAYNFLFVDQSSPNLFCSTGNESPLISQFTACRYIYAFQRYSQSRSKVCLFTSHQILDVFALQNFKWVVPPPPEKKLYLH